MADRRSEMGQDRGSVLLETAMAVPLLLAVAAALVWVVSVGAGYVRALDAAQTAARQVARGASPPPGPFALQVSDDDSLVRVRATQHVVAPVPFLTGWGIDVQAEAVAVREGVSP